MTTSEGTMTSNAGDEEPSKSTTSRNDSVDYIVAEDEAIFGRLNEDIADYLCQCLETHLRAGASGSLPMANGERVDRMVSRHLLPKYLRGIDVAEVYAKRHVFSLAMFPPTQRQKIAARFHSDSTHTTSELDNTVPAVVEDMDQDDKDERMDAIHRVLDENENPADRLQKVRQETIEMQAQWRELQRRRAATEQALEETKAAAMMTERALGTDQLDWETLQGLLDRVPQLLRRQHEAQQLIGRMEDIKRGRSEEEKRDAEEVVMPYVSRPVKPLGLLEQFERDRRQTGGMEQLVWLQSHLASS